MIKILFKESLIILISAIISVSTVHAASTDTSFSNKELTRLWMEVLKNPNSVEKNLSYASLAEKMGFYNKAILSYERILFFAPDNRIAKEKIAQIKLLTRPSETNISVIASAEFSTNAALSGDAHENNISLSEIIAISDERKVFNERLQSNFVHLADAHTKLSDSDMVYNKVESGPLIVLNTAVTWYPSLSLEFVHVDGRLDNHSLEIKNSLRKTKGLIRDVSLSIKRVIVHGEGSLGAYNVSGNIESTYGTSRIYENSALSFILYGEVNDNDDSFDTLGFREHYVHVGGNMKGTVPISSNFSIDLSLNVSHRHYFNYSINETETRNDLNLGSGIELTYVPTFINNGAIITSYNIQRNFSNDNDSRYLNNVINISTVYSF